MSSVHPVQRLHERQTRRFEASKVSKSTNLGLAVGPSPPQRPVPPQRRHLLVEPMREDDRQRHALFRLVRSVAKHETLRSVETKRHRLE